MPHLRLAPARLSTLNEALRPVAKTYRSACPQLALRAFAYRSRSAAITSDELVTWLVDHSGLPDIANLASRSSVLDPLLADAAAHDLRSNSLAGRQGMRHDAAERLVGHLLLPVPEYLDVSPAMAAKARRALAVLGPEFLVRAGRDGFDSINFSIPDVRCALGVSPGTAASLMKVCKAAGWVSSPRSSRGKPSRWRLRPLTETKREGIWAYGYGRFVDALAGGDLKEPFVELFYLADHPAFGYGEAPLDHRVWLTAVACHVSAVGSGSDAAASEFLEVKATACDLGVPAKRVPAFRRDLLGVIDNSPGSATLTEALDVHAHLSRADVAMAAARADREREKAARLDSRDESRAQKAGARAAETVRHRALTVQVHRVLDRLLAKAPIPAVTASTAEQVAWTKTVSALMTDARLEAEALALMHKALTARLTRAGHPAERATRVAAHLTKEAA